MQLDKVFVCDIETTGFLDSIESFKDLHVFGCAYKSSKGNWEIKTTNDFNDIKKVVDNPNNTLVFHNGILYDKPVLIKMGFEFNAFIIDTLGLSYYLYGERDKHGLASWGEFFGVSKPEIESWTGLSYEEYVNRVTEDCKINTNLWVMMLSYLRNIYGEDDKVISAIKKINHKMDQLALQDKNPIFINVPECKKNLQFLDSEVAESKEAVLNSLLPKIPVKKIVSPPKKGILKKDGTLSEAGKKWLTYVQACNLPDDYSGNIEVITGYKDPNCNSSDQMKSYLLNKGWIPTIYKDGAKGKVPQLRDDDKNLCPNIIKLIEEYPELEALSGLSVARHRAGYLKSMLKNVNEDGYARAWASGFTRTLRLKHAAPFANLPKPNAEHGRLVRGVMAAPEGYVCIGADLSSIEDKCKQVSIFQLDPNYVQSMNTSGWDAHLALGLTAKMFTQEEVDFYKWYNNRDKENSPYVCPDRLINLNEDEMHSMFDSLSKKRAVAKTGTYSCLPMDTEVLSIDGWKRFDEISEGDALLSYNEKKDIVEPDVVLKKHFFTDKEVIRFKNNYDEFRCTSEHRWYGWRRYKSKNISAKKVFGFFEASDITTEHNIILSKPYIGGGVELDKNVARLLGYLLSDGYWSWSKKGIGNSSSNGKKQGIYMMISQSINKFSKDVEDTLNLCGVGFRKDTVLVDNGNHVHRFIIVSKDARLFLDNLFPRQRFDKHEFNWSSWIISLSNTSREFFLEGFFLGDGGAMGRIKRGDYTITQNKGNIFDAITIAMQLGGVGRVTVKNKTLKHRVARLQKRQHITCQELHKENIGVQDTFCLTTNNSSFIIKQGGFIGITGNCTYGAGAQKISESTGLSLGEAKQLHKGYWDLNWSVKKFAEDRVVKTVRGTNWLKVHKNAGGTIVVKETNWIYNEYTGLWMFLKNEKDRFSACNQSMGVFIFDVWVWYLMKYGIKISATWHDEAFWYCKEDEVDKHIDIIKKSIDSLNKYFNFPVSLECDYKIGKTYADVH